MFSEDISNFTLQTLEKLTHNCLGMKNHYQLPTLLNCLTCDSFENKFLKN